MKKTETTRVRPTLAGNRKLADRVEDLIAERDRLAGMNATLVAERDGLREARNQLQSRVEDPDLVFTLLAEIEPSLAFPALLATKIQMALDCGHVVTIEEDADNDGLFRIDAQEIATA